MQPTCVILRTLSKLWLPQKVGLFRCSQNVSMGAGAKKGTDEVDVSKFPLQLGSSIVAKAFFIFQDASLQVDRIWSPFVENSPHAVLDLKRSCFVFLPFSRYIFLVYFIILKIPFCQALSFWQYLVQWSSRCANASDSGEIVECHHRYNMCYKAVISISYQCNQLQSNAALF